MSQDEQCKRNDVPTPFEMAKDAFQTLKEANALFKEVIDEKDARIKALVDSLVWLRGIYFRETCTCCVESSECEACQTYKSMMSPETIKILEGK